MLCEYIFLIHSHCFGVGIIQYKNDTTIRGYVSTCLHRVTILCPSVRMMK